MKLWPHQHAAVEAATSAIRSGRRSGLWSMPTGTGKTIAFATVARILKWPTLVLVHRDELVRQTVDAFDLVWPAASVGVVKAERNEIDGRDVVVASVQSLHAKRLAQVPTDRFSLVVPDEAHHVVADTWSAVLDHFASRFVLGCTATPERFDGRGLADRFGAEPIYTYPLRQAIEDGRLVRLKQYAVETDLDLDGVTYRAGDFAQGELSERINTETRNRLVVDAFKKHARDRRTVAFCVDVKHAHALRDAFLQAGVFAATVTGTTPKHERRRTLDDFANGKTQLVTNVAVLSEGFDQPGISCVLMARPTMSRSLYTQCIGRGLRLAPDKDDCLVLDFTANSRKHKLITVLDLFGNDTSRDAGGSDVIEFADRKRAEAERRNTIELQAPLRWRLATVCPWPVLPCLEGYVRTLAWHDQPASDKQFKYLRCFGVSLSRELTRGEASYLIDRCRESEAAFPAPATAKQSSCLRRAGLWRDGMTKREASGLIAGLIGGKRNGRLPHCHRPMMAGSIPAGAKK